MTEEELEKEAEEYRKEKLKEQKDKFVFELPEVYVADIKQAYLAGAEPREKRIAELERKLEQTEKDLADYQFNYPTIKELQKENTELEKKLKALEGQTPWKDIKDKSEVIRKLTAAKEIIREFVEWATWQGSNCPNFKSIQDKAEAFLNSEVDKC